MRKLFTLLTLALVSIGSAWGETETPGSTATSNKAITGTSYSIDGTFIAGPGSPIVSPMESKGVKVRLNRADNTMTIKVNDGYQIDAMTIYAVANDDSKTNSVTSIKVDDVEKLAASITIPNRKASTAATISVTDMAKSSIVLTFGGGTTQGLFDFHFQYTQNEVITQEITAVTLNGSAISDDNLATLKSTKTLSIDGSSLNGLGALNVSLSSGATTVNREFEGTSAVYTFTINSTEEYTIKVTNVVKTYTLQGLPVYYKKGDTGAEGIDTEELTANGITFTYPSKTFGYGNGNVTISGDVYQPIKLSTGEGVTVTFPTGKKASKIIVYGWSADGAGYMKTFKNASDGEKSIDTNDNKFYALNTADDIYPSVYEYDVDEWDGLFFECAGGQPFVVIDFVFAEKITITPATEYSTYVTTQALDFSSVSGLEAYVATSANTSSVTIEKVTAVPANTPLILKGTAGTDYSVPVAASASAPATNYLKAGDGTTTIGGDSNFDYILKDGKFWRANAGTVAVGKAYLHLAAAPSDARMFEIDIDGYATGINMVNGEGLKVNGSETYYDLQGRRVLNPTKGLYIVNGKKVIMK